MRVINDPLGQTHSSASSDHYSGLNFVLFCEILMDGWTEKETMLATGMTVGLAEWIIDDSCLV